MKKRNNITAAQRLPLLAGWLFADLFLVLFVVSLASIPPKHAAPHPVQPPPPVSRVLAKPVSFSVPVSPDLFESPVTRRRAASRLLASLRHNLAIRGLGDKQAGVFLVFASGSSAQINQAIANAKTVIGIVRSRLSAFAKASPAAYWSGGGNAIKFEIFFYSTPAPG